MNTDALKETIRKELPALLREDPALRAFLQDLMREQYAGRQETDDKFERLLGELRRDREALTQKWDEQDRRWEEQHQRWEEQGAKWEEQNRKWDEQTALLKDFMAEQKRLWQENTAERERRWEENKREFDWVHQEIMALAERHDRSVGALGSRWGIQSEATFRNALAGVLERHFDVQVVRVDEFDDKGSVFGRPDQVELDLIVKNGLLIICELKSSIGKADMYAFERKARFYEERHGRKANRLMVISPMIGARARKVAERLGIELFSDSEDVREL
jgi:YD repeat-containing protein